MNLWKEFNLLHKIIIISLLTWTLTFSYFLFRYLSYKSLAGSIGNPLYVYLFQEFPLGILLTSLCLIAGLGYGIHSYFESTHSTF